MTKMMLAMVLGLGFSVAGCMETATEADIAETEQGLTGGHCVVLSATDNHMNGWCYANGLEANRPIACHVGQAFGTPVLGGTFGGNPAYINQLPCQ